MRTEYFDSAPALSGLRLGQMDSVTRGRDAKKKKRSLGSFFKI